MSKIIGMALVGCLTIAVGGCASGMQKEDTMKKDKMK